ncbi:peroxiredoxin-like family protein [Maribacter sp. 2-571]|uniref:peroxiredoxin-like family protein n=1 Tax=Maribacter sp. 2-571 TaxID=3417569 RepID=UPI003D34E77C
MPLQKGDHAPNFIRYDIHGEEVHLHSLKHEKILLTFFRYAECALCNLRIAELQKEKDRFRELDIHLIAIFQSSKGSLLQSAYQHHKLHFSIIAEPELELYRLYHVHASWSKLFRTIDFKGIRSMIDAKAAGFSLGGRVEGKFHQIPADFLIDRSKHIEIVHYGRNLIDHIPLEMILKKTP